MAVSGPGDLHVVTVNTGVTASISNLTIENGQETHQYGNIAGGGIYNNGTLNLTNDTITGNSADGMPNAGAGIYNSGTGTLFMMGSTVSNNVAYNGYAGGGIYNAGHMTLMNDIFTGNSATTGGAIANSGTLTLSNATITGNSAFIVAGIYNTGHMTVSNSNVSDNTSPSDSGGGFENTGTLTITDSTIASNLAYQGGGIFNESGPLTLTNDTITGNSAVYGSSATKGGGLLVSGGSVTMVNTIVANNTATGGDPDVDGTLAAATYDLIGNTSGLTITGSTATDLLGTSAGLSSLQSNGGPTQTVALLPSSPAIGKAGAVTTVTTGTTITNTGTTSLVVGNGAAIASTPGQYYITVDGVEMVVTNASGNTLTVENVSVASVTVSANDPVYLYSDQRGIALAIPADIGAFQLETVNPSSATLFALAPTLTITGSAFDTTAANDGVSFTNTGVTGTVTSATSTSLTVSLSGMSTLATSTALVGSVTVDGVSSGSAVQLATVVVPTTVYVDPDWAGDSFGTTVTDPVSGNMAIYGENAFSVVNAGVAAVALNGNVLVDAGTAGGYTQDVNVTRDVTVTIQQGPTFFNSLADTAGIGDNLVLDYTLTVGADGNSTAYSGVISGVGGLTKAGTGTFTVSGESTYTGVTTLAGGDINVDAVENGTSGPLGNDTTLTFTGGTLQYSTVDTADYSAHIANSTGAIAIDTNGQSVTFGTSLASNNTGGLTKYGNGTLTLSVSNAYTGTTTIAGTSTTNTITGVTTFGSVLNAGVAAALGGERHYQPHHLRRW